MHGSSSQNPAALQSEQTIRRIFPYVVCAAALALTFAGIVPFYHHLGLSTRWIVLTRALLGITCALFQIPTGIVSDRFGRKVALGCAGLCLSLGALPAVFSHNSSLVFAGECLMFVGVSFHNGTDVALLYDSLESIERLKDFPLFLGRLKGCAIASIALWALIGGTLSQISVRLPWLVVSAAGLVLALLALSMTEPSLNDSSGANSASGDTPAGRAIALILGSRRIRWVLTIATITLGASEAGKWIFRLYLPGLGFNSFVTGLVICGAAVVTMIASLSAPRLLLIAPEKIIAVASLGIIGIAGVALGCFPGAWTLLVVVPQKACVGYVGVMYGKLLNGLIDRTERAVVNSIQEMASQILAASLILVLSAVSFSSDWPLYTLLGCSVLMISVVVPTIYAPADQS